MRAPTADGDPASPALVAVCTAEALTDASAGPALRAAGLARGLVAHGLEVVLVAPEGSRAPDGCALASLGDIPRIVGEGATLVASGFLVERYPGLTEAGHLVVDAAGPFLIENLVVHETKSSSRRRNVLVDEAAVLTRLLAAADLILCAQPRQRDLTLGMLLAAAALRPELLDGDPGLTELLMIVPFGPTGATEPLAREPEPGRLHLVWPGGLWDWLDPVSLIEAVGRARSEGADITVELWGARSPDPLVPPPRAAELVARSARLLGLGDAVDIVDWVPHAERGVRLASADLAVTLDHAGIEARYAFRTRLVDALAAGLPVVATEGEFVADEAARRGAGFTVSPGDPRSLADLLVSLATDPSKLAAARAQAPRVAGDWAYELTVGPLARWCRAPRRARPGAPDATPRRALARSLGRVRRRSAS